MQSFRGRLRDLRVINYRFLRISAQVVKGIYLINMFLLNKVSAQNSSLPRLFTRLKYKIYCLIRSLLIHLQSQSAQSRRMSVMTALVRHSRIR